MPEREFNLLHEPWIRVLKQNCLDDTVSLCTLFEQAHTYRELGGELPTQDAAVLRLLLAILHAVFERVDETGCVAPIKNEDDALDRWEALWKRGHFPAQIVNDYLSRYEDRFWLFDKERPFYQAPETERLVAKQFSVSKLNGAISESANKVKLFPIRTGANKERLTYGEAARWLLHINAVDDCAVKKTDNYKRTHPKDAETEASGASVGWLGRLGIVEAVGSNLFETLMLNLVLYYVKENKPWGDEKPIWENDNTVLRERTLVSLPDNQSELLTLPSRFVMLHRRDGFVDQYSIVSGLYFSPINAFTEQMTLWRQTKPTRSQPVPYFYPMKHDAAQYIWQEFAAMFSQTITQLQGKDNERPGLVLWLNKLASGGVIRNASTIRFKTVNVQYCKAQSSSIDEVASDIIAMRLDLLKSDNSGWLLRIQSEIDRCSQMAYVVGTLAKDLARAAGEDGGDDAAAEARTQFYYRVDMPFRQWLLEIDPSEGDNKDELAAKWRETVYGIARALGSEMVAQTGVGAFTGRKLQLDKNKEKQWYTAPQAYNWFLFNIAKLK